jgi:hypothetical protein
MTTEVTALAVLGGAMTLLDKGSGTQDSEVLLMRRERQGSECGCVFWWCRTRFRERGMSGLARSSPDEGRVSSSPAKDPNTPPPCSIRQIAGRSLASAARAAQASCRASVSRFQRCAWCAPVLRPIARQGLRVGHDFLTGAGTRPLRRRSRRAGCRARRPVAWPYCRRPRESQVPGRSAKHRQDRSRP